MESDRVCRYCGNSFTARPGKPGRADECEQCLGAKNAPTYRTYDEDIRDLRNALFEKIEWDNPRRGISMTRDELEEAVDQEMKAHPRIKEILRQKL